MNLKNHTTPRFWELTGDRGEVPAYAHSTTYKFNLKDIPPVTRRMCNYLVGVLVSVAVAYKFDATVEGQDSNFLDASDIARALFDSAEIQQTMFGTPVSANHYLGKFFGLFEFVGNGMQAAVCPPAPAGSSTVVRPQTFQYFIPVSALLGMKGHHTCQPAVCYDRAQFILRTAAAGAVPGFTVGTYNGFTNQIKVEAVLNPEPELRLGPGTSFMRYVQTASSAGTLVNLDALGNSTTLEGAEPGAGLAWLAWMGDSLRAFGGAGAVAGLEYLAVPFRDIQMTRNLEGFFADWMNACGSTDLPWVNDDIGTYGLAGAGHKVGYLYPPDKYPDKLGLHDGAEFLPIITPHKFLETSKLQVVQGTQSVALKSSVAFDNEHVFCALQYHSWTPAKMEEVLRKLIDSGVAMAVWGTNDLVPKVKITNKQPAGSINPAKTRFFATTWEPKAVVSTPPTT